MAGKSYMDGLWVSQGQVAKVCEEVTEPGQNPTVAGASKQFVAGQVGKRICMTDPTNSGGLLSKEYQYVLRDDSTQLNTVPCILQWANPTNGLFAVELADGSQAIAGIFLGDDTAAVGDQGMQDGCYGFIGSAGPFQVQCGGNCTQGSDLTTTQNGLAVDRTTVAEPLLGVALETGTTGDNIWVLLQLAHID